MKLLKDAIELIEDNLFLDYSVEKLSQDLHYSKYHLSREFNTRIGLSIPMYMKLRRMTEAALVLSKDEYQVSDIAFQCGYNSVSYFIKGFKEVFGITPHEYRKGYHYVQLLRKVDIGGRRVFNNVNRGMKMLFYGGIITKHCLSFQRTLKRAHSHHQVYLLSGKTSQ